MRIRNWRAGWPATATPTTTCAAAPSRPKTFRTSLVNGKILGKTGFGALPASNLGQQAVDFQYQSERIP
jgi:hypothetical protein